MKRRYERQKTNPAIFERRQPEAPSYPWRPTLEEFTAAVERWWLEDMRKLGINPTPSAPPSP